MQSLCVFVAFWQLFLLVANAHFLKWRCKGNTFLANFQIFLEKNAKNRHFFGILPIFTPFKPKNTLKSKKYGN